MVPSDLEVRAAAVGAVTDACDDDGNCPSYKLPCNTAGPDIELSIDGNTWSLSKPNYIVYKPIFILNEYNKRFGNHKLTLARRENKDDSAELMLEDEFIGVVFRDDEDGDTCYHVQITVLAEDLDD